MDYNSIAYFECDCGSEIIRLECFVKEKGKEHFLQEFSFAIFEYRMHTYSFIDRIKIAFRVLFKGRIYGDQIVLNTDTALKLANFIKTECDEIKDIIFTIQNSDE
jgi:hypothetical protein